MAVDIRATVTCSLGTLISGSIGDDYLQNNGLIRTRGSVVISGTITPAIGTVVTFSYTKGGVTRNIPRKLRVLSSFADPYRRTTSVELGCKLTYLADLRPAVNWSVFNDPNNSTYNEDDSKIVTLPIWSSSVMNECLTQLGISASGIPVTNNFSIGSFDFSAGYVSVLSDILVSECYCGYLDYNEVLQIINLRNDGGTGPVYTESNIIDHGPINSGQLPGEAVTVSYSTLKLKKPDPAEPLPERERRNWERESSRTGPNKYYIGNRVYTGMETVSTQIQYQTIGDVDVPVRRVSEERGSTAKVAGSIGSAYVQNGLSFNARTAVLRREVETNEYDKDGNRTRTEVEVFETNLAFYGSVSLDYVYPPTTPGGNPDSVDFPNAATLRRRERSVTTYNRIGTAEQQITKTYAAWLISGPGQQAIAENRPYLTSATDVANFINAASGAGLVLERNIVTINTRNTINGRPLNTSSASLAKGGNPSTDYRQQNTAQLQLALGSGAAQRRIEFSMPYAPDDFFSGPSGGPFTTYPSDAPTKANNFGRVQNRLLLGNRNGMNIQLAPEVLPAAPFAPMYVQANGLTAQYRANGNQWSFDSNGIVCSTDALFWAAVGGTGVFWFPVAPGVTTLPTTPPIVGGNITPGVTIPPYNETVEVRASAGPVIRVTSIPYSLQPQLTVIDRLALRSTVQAARIRKVEIPAAAITVAAVSPTILASGSGTPAALILHFDGTTLVDSSVNNYTVTASGNAALSDTQSKFGGKSLSLDGFDGFVETTGAELALGTGNWTVQAWIRLEAGNTDERCILQFGTNYGPGLWIYPSGGDSLVAWLDDSLTFEAFSDPITEETWVHVLASKENTTLRVFVGGVKSTSDYTLSGSTSTSNITSTTVRVGGSDDYTAIFNGYIDDAVIEPGRVVTTNFTPPTTAYS